MGVGPRPAAIVTGGGMNCARVRDGALEGVFCSRARRFAWLKGVALSGALVLAAAVFVLSESFETLWRAFLQ